jgi:CBS domain containing-hemolysin-like protein
VSEFSWLHALLGALLLCSGFFSASEAALFSLSPVERRNASRSAQALLDDPRRLLATILMANLVVNTLFFAFAGRLVPDAQGWHGAALGLAVLVVLLLGGEILPKILALRARRAMSNAGAPVLRLLVTFLHPLTRPLLFVLEALHRGPLRWVKSEGGITPEILARVLARGAVEGALHEREADLLSGVVELEDIRAGEIMRPRVDTLFLDVSGEERGAVTRLALEQRLTWLPVIDGDQDSVLGRVLVRDLVRHAGTSLAKLVQPVKFVPEVASALDVLRSLRADGASEAVVVDEYGGTAGVVTAENAFEEILGDLRVEGEESQPSVVALEGGRFRVAGDLSIREWNEAFGLEVVPNGFETVAGFVTALLGRIPRVGDQVHVGALVLEVHAVRRRRVLLVDIGLEAKAEARGRAG